ncbi:MAG TPA: hypothetical protein VHB25_17575 [Gemmatimonadaceae bacterium]|nr:hypothetical protein [Gemmatimonadaceae bacterium]
MRHALFAPVAAVVVAACSASRTKSADAAPPPPAEFLVSTAESTFWIRTTTGKLELRGEPLMLAHYDGRFYELYTADDDYSYQDALLVGERLYRRDLLSGDSVMVFADTTVPRVALAYARTHPDERPLDPDDDVDDDPATSATAEVDVLNVHGPFVSYEYHVDLTLPGRAPWHTTRRGVIDLRSGKSATVADLFGDSAATRIASSALAAFQAERDSVLRGGVVDAESARAMRALASLAFDPRSFTLTDDADRRALVRFALPTRGAAAGGNALELEPVPAPDAAWWADVRGALPATDSAGTDRWRHRGYVVVARYDTSGASARLALVDSARHEWPITAVAAPLHRIDWLDDPPIGAAERHALSRAFDQAATYDENAQVASYRSGHPSPARRPAFHLTHSASRTPHFHAPVQDREGKPARDLGAHDAGARQQHGPRVRRRDSVDDGQVRGDLRVPAQPRGGRHGVHRPRRLS